MVHLTITGNPVVGSIPLTHQTLAGNPVVGSTGQVQLGPIGAQAATRGGCKVFVAAAAGQLTNKAKRMSEYFMPHHTIFSEHALVISHPVNQSVGMWMRGGDYFSDMTITGGELVL